MSLAKMSIVEKNVKNRTDSIDEKNMITSHTKHKFPSDQSLPSKRTMTRWDTVGTKAIL